MQDTWRYKGLFLGPHRNCCGIVGATTLFLPHSHNNFQQIQHLSRTLGTTKTEFPINIQIFICFKYDSSAKSCFPLHYWLFKAILYGRQTISQPCLEDNVGTVSILMPQGPMMFDYVVGLPAVQIILCGANNCEWQIETRMLCQK